MPRRKIEIRPAHLVFAGAAVSFVILLALTGWTWSLDGVAVVLPIAAYLLFS